MTIISKIKILNLSKHHEYGDLSIPPKLPVFKKKPSTRFRRLQFIKTNRFGGLDSIRLLFAFLRDHDREKLIITKL